MDVFDLMAKIGLDNSEFDKNLTASEGKFDGFGKKIASGAKTIGKVGVAAFAAIGTAITGTTAALIKNAGETAAYADQIDKASQKIGFSAEAYQEWDFILQHSGSSIDSVKGALIKLEKAAEGGGEAFEKLGINQEEFLAMGSQEQFETAVAALQGVSDETERAALAQDLFGKSYQELMPLLNTSAEDTAAMKEQVHELNGVMSDEAVKAGAQYQDSLKNMQTAFGGLKNNLMGEFLPSMSTVMDGLAALFSGDESGIAKVKEGIQSLASTISSVLPQAIQIVSGIAEALLSALPELIGVIGEQLPGILERTIPLIIDAVVGLADAVVKALPGIMSAIEKNISVISQGLTKIFKALGQIILKLLPTLLPVLLKIGVELIKELAKGFTENASEIIRSILEVINIIVNELTNPETLTTILECGIQIVVAIAEGILQNLPQLLETLLTLVGNIVEFLITDGIPLVLDGAVKLFEAIGDGVLKAWDFITKKLGELIGKIIGEDGIGGWLSDILGKAQEAFEAIGDAIGAAWDTITGAVKEFGEKIWNGIKEGVGDLYKKGQEMVEKIVEGIKSVWYKITDWIGGGSAISDSLAEEMKQAGKDSANAYYEGQIEGYEIKSPSKKMAYIGRMVMAGFSGGIEDEAPRASQEIDSAFDEIRDIDVPTFNVDGIGMRAGKSGNGQDAGINRLVESIKEFAQNRPDEIIQVFVGDRQIEEILISGKNRITTRSGGQVNV